MRALPATMRAIEGLKPGPVSALKLVTARPVPRPQPGTTAQPGTVLVRVKSAALNPACPLGCCICSEACLLLIAWAVPLLRCSAGNSAQC